MNVVHARKRSVEMKKQIFALILLSLVLALTFTPTAQSDTYDLRFQELRSSIVVIAYCYHLDSEINVNVVVNSVSAGFTTPYAFNFLNETCSITVPRIDNCGHRFVAWNTGEKNPIITVSSEGVYVAYYAPFPPLLKYNAVINTSSNGEGNLQVTITKDGNLTDFDAPYTFTNLTGIHTFTVPYIDSNGNKFQYWVNPLGTLTYSPTILVSSGGTYTACYDVGLCQYITPSDPTIVEVARDKSWIEMLDYVSSEVSYGDNTHWQMPNETLALGSGKCKDYATLYVSMLRSCGYEAYVVIGTTNLSGTGESHAWAVFNFNETFFHVEPQWAAHSQKFVNFTSYESEYYFDESRIITSLSSSNPPLLSDKGDCFNVFPVLLLAVVFVTVTSLSMLVVGRKENKL